MKSWLGQNLPARKEGRLRFGGLCNPYTSKDSPGTLGLGKAQNDNKLFS